MNKMIEALGKKMSLGQQQDDKSEDKTKPIISSDSNSK